MNKDINKLLEKLEPEITKKCTEIRERKNNKNKQVIYISLLIIFITIPSLLIIFNINIIYFIIGSILLILLTTFMKLPYLLNCNIKGVHYE